VAVIQSSRYVFDTIFDFDKNFFLGWNYRKRSLVCQDKLDQKMKDGYPMLGRRELYLLLIEVQYTQQE